MSEDAVVKFTNQLKKWQQEGYYVLLKNFYNMPEKNKGFVVSADETAKTFTYKLYVNKVLDEKTFAFDQVDDLIKEIDETIKN